MVTFKGFVKNGLDSSVLINLVVGSDSSFKRFEEEGFTFPPNVFYFHEVSIPEVLGVLRNRFNFSRSEAVESFNKLVSEFNLQKIKIDEKIDETFDLLVIEANKKVVENHGKNFGIGDQDVIIIAGFFKEKMNFVHSGDKGFLKTCEELGMTPIQLPMTDFIKEKEIKGWMKNRK